MAATKPLLKKERPKRKMIDLGERFDAPLKEAAERTGEPETTVVRICLQHGLDALKRAGFKLGFAESDAPGR